MNNTPKLIKQQATRITCPNCGGRGRRIRQFEGYFCILAWIECFDCDFYRQEFDKSALTRRIW